MYHGKYNVGIKSVIPQMKVNELFPLPKFLPWGFVDGSPSTKEIGTDSPFCNSHMPSKYAIEHWHVEIYIYI